MIDRASYRIWLDAVAEMLEQRLYSQPSSQNTNMPARTTQHQKPTRSKKVLIDKPRHD